MSNSRRFRRLLPVPDHVQRAAAAQHCRDCESEVRIRRAAGGLFETQIRHDDSCPQLRFREEHRMTHGLALVAPPGKAVSPGPVVDVAAALAAQPGVRGVRVGTSTDIGRSERDEIERRIGGDAHE